MVVKRKNKGERRLEKELIWIAAFAVFLVLVFVVSNEIFKSFNRSEYEGLTFTKERAGNLDIYHYSYYFEDRGDLIKHNLFVRKDPATNEVPVRGEVIFDKGKDVYITLDTTDLEECPYSVLAVGDLAKFLADNRFRVKSGLDDFYEAGRKRQEYVTCANRPDDSVILIRKGEKTKITAYELCFEIEVANCEILDAIEKFKVQSVVDAREFG